MRDYALGIGMNIEEDSDLLWIAREGLKAALPKGWVPWFARVTSPMFSSYFLIVGSFSHSYFVIPIVTARMGWMESFITSIKTLVKVHGTIHAMKCTVRS